MYYTRMYLLEVTTMTISLRLNNDEAALMKKYAQMNGVTMSDLVRKCVLEHIENEYDLKAYQAALAEYRADSETFTLDEVEKELGLK